MSDSRDNPVLWRLLQATNAAELKAAAVALSRIRDASNHEVSKYLQEGERIYKAYMRDGKTKR